MRRVLIYKEEERRRVKGERRGFRGRSGERDYASGHEVSLVIAGLRSVEIVPQSGVKVE